MAEEKSTVKKAMITVSVIIGLIGGFLGLNKYFVNREVYDIKCEASETRFQIIEAGMSKAFQGIQNQIAVQNAQNQYDALQRQEINLLQMQAMARTPQEKQNIQDQINYVRQQKTEALRNLNNLKGR